MQGEAFEEAAKKYQNSIYAVAFHYFKNPHDANDMVQEVLLKLYQTDKAFESDDHLRHWLLRVTVNQCKKLSLSAWFCKHTSLEAYAKTLQYETAEESELFFAVMALPQKYRVVVHLYYYEEFSVQEIGEILHRNPATVRTQLRRARNLLKERLTDVWQDE